MSQLKFLGRELHISRFEKDDKLLKRKIEEPKLNDEPKYTINEILDKVEDGNLFILEELGISYTETTTELGNKKISFEYLGTKYSVIIINNMQANEEVSQTTNNTKIIKNEDGSSVIYEYDENGVLIKSSEYDKNGKITHEYVLKEDGSQSDKFYTYENNELVQIQETIHYADGNYTYIFTDGNGKLKEEQKVMHNELGGLTFDTTFENGTRKVIVFDANGNNVKTIFYSVDGNIDKTEEYNYDINNPNFYTVITKDADGNIIKEENWENYTFIDENETTWYGSHILKSINYDDEGNISNIIQFEYNGIYTTDIKSGKLLDELKELANDYQEQIDNILVQISSLNVPTLPNAFDYKKSSDGLIDEEAYNKVLQQYNEQMSLYYNQVQELNNKLTELQNKLQQVNKQIAELEFETKFTNIENNINELKNLANQNNELIALLEKTLEDLKQNLLEQPNKKLEIQKKIQDICNQRLNLKVPTPPSSSDFIKPDGSVDEEAYKLAFDNYEYEKYQYDKKMQELNAKVSTLRNELNAIDMEIQKQSDELEQLDKNVNAVKTIQDMINNIEDKENNKDLISKLNQKLNDIYNNIKAQYEIRRIMDTLFDNLKNEELPIPPSTLDYMNPDGSVDEVAYSKAFAEYQKALKEYEQKIQQFNANMQKATDALNNLTNQVDAAVFDATVAVVENKIAQLRKSGNNLEADKLETKLKNLKREHNLI